MPLLEGVDFGASVGDKAFDADWLAAELDARGAAAAVPSKSNGKNPRDHDEEMRKWRRRIENYFAKIKEFRAIATRCDKTVAGFGSFINLVAGVISAR